MSDYHAQAQAFLDKHWIKFRATLSNTKAPAWGEDGKEHGHHYRVTLSRTSKREPETFAYRGKEMAGYRGMATYFSHKEFPSRLVFDFWGSIADAKAGKDPTPYDVLACISGDIHFPAIFADFCDEYGYDADSISALQTFRRMDRFGKRLREFFTPEEIEELQEIQ